MAKRASLRDVARAADVSIGTVSNYLNKTAPVSLETQANIQKAIDELGYKRNEIARSLRCATTKTLGVIFPNISNPFYSSLFHGAEEEARRNGYTITLGISHYDNAVVRQYLNSFYDRQMDGVIVDGYCTYCGEDMFGDEDMPIVVIEPPPGIKVWSTIEIDNRAAAREAVEYLIDLGHQHIALIMASGPSLFDERYMGYQAALEASGLAFDADLIVTYDPFAGDLIAQGEKAIQTLLARTSFTACFIASDIVAISALTELNKRGFRVPEDIALIGFDNIALSALTMPPLTTVAQPHHEMGSIAVQILLQHLDKEPPVAPIHKVLNHQLIIRGSTGFHADT